jgi:eukaryotic-like serine/threonine-protein kinase
LPEIGGLPPEVLDLCSRCLSRDPAERPTALVAALLLAEAVDARVYVPIRDIDPAATRPSISPWDQRAAEAPTSAALPAARRPDPDRSTDRLGRHRA